MYIPSAMNVNVTTNELGFSSCIVLNIQSESTSRIIRKAKNPTNANIGMSEKIKPTADKKNSTESILVNS